MVSEKSVDITGSDDQAMHMMVDMLRKSVFAAQKSTGMQSQQTQCLISCLSALSSALDSSRRESPTTTSLIVSTANKSMSTVATASGLNPSFRLHVNSIIQSMYTLFTRVLTPPAIKRESLGTTASVSSSAGVTSITDVKHLSTGSHQNPTRPDMKVNSSVTSKQSPAFDDQLLLKVQSLGLLSSVATCDPSKNIDNNIDASVVMLDALHLTSCQLVVVLFYD